MHTMQCSNCGQELEAGAAFCGNCGAKILSAAPQAVVATAVPMASIPEPALQPAVTLTPAVAQPTQATAMAVAKQSHPGLSITGMIFGILALLSSLIWLVALPFAVLAIIFSAVGIRKGGKGMAISGFILGGLGAVATIAFTVGLVLLGDQCPKNATDDFCKGYNSTDSIILPFRQ